METNVVNSKANDLIGLNINPEGFTEEVAIEAMNKLKAASTLIRDAFFTVADEQSDMEDCPSFIFAQNEVNNLISIIGRKYGELIAERIIVA